MEYEVISKVNEEQLEKIKNEYNRIFNPESLMIIKADGQEIGFGSVLFICGRLTLEYYLFRDYQHQGYGPMFVNILTDAVGEKYSLYDSLYLAIHMDNKPSSKVATKCGYKLDNYDWEFRTILDDDMPGYYLYSKKNKYYKERKLKKTIPNQA